VNYYTKGGENNMTLSGFTQDIKNTIVSVIKGADDIASALREALG